MTIIAKKTAIVYCRTSTGGQKEAETIKAQDNICERLVEHHDLRVVPYGPKGDGWLKDDGISGTLLAGRAFATLIDDLHHDRVKIDYLVVPFLSRLSRPEKTSKDRDFLVQSAQDNARIMAVLNGAGVKIIDQSGVNDPASILTDIKQLLSGQELADIRKRTMAGKERVLSKGGWATGGRPPYGYRRVFRNGRDKKDATTLAPHPVDGPRFRQLMTWYVERGAAHAARKAKEAGWPAPRGDSRWKHAPGKVLMNWYPSTVQGILKKLRVYLGEKTLTIDGNPYDVTYPALLDPNTYAAITRRMKERTLKRRTTLLSTGYLDCACGRHVHGYRSSTAEHFHVRCRGQCGTMREDLLAAKLWELTVARLVQIKEHEQVFTGRTDPYGPQLASARARLAHVQDRIDRLVALYLENFDRSALDKQSELLREEKATLQMEVKRIEGQRDAHAQRKIGEETVQTRVQTLLKFLRRGGVRLELRRRVLSDLLQGERLVLTWNRTTVPHATVTLPPFGDLPAIMVRLDHDVTTQFHGMTQDVLDLYFETDDAVEEIAM